MKFFLLLLALTFPISTVENIRHERPVHEKWSLQEEEIWRTERYGSTPIYIPSITAVSPSEEIVVYDWKHHENFILDRQGKLIGRFGNRGEGPGEIGWQYQVRFDSTIRVLDNHRGIIDQFDSRGGYISSRRIEKKHGRAKRLEPPKGYLCFPDHPPFKIIHVNPPDEGVRELVELADREGINFHLQGEGQQRATLVIPALTPRILALYHAPSDSYYYGISNQPVIYRMDRNGIVTRRIAINKKPRTMTARMRKELSREIHVPESVCAKIGGQLNFFSRIEIVDDLLLIYGMGFGDLWSELELDILSPDGQYLAHVVFDPGEDIRLHCNYLYSVEFQNGHMFTAQEDESGDYHLVKYAVRLPKAMKQS